MIIMIIYVLRTTHGILKMFVFCQVAYGTIRMISVTSVIDYLKHLHLF